MATPSDYYKDLAEDELRRNNLFPQRSEISFYSSATGGLVEDTTALDSQFWADNLVSPVLFQSAVTKINQKLPDSVFLEIGPHSTLAGIIRSICANDNFPFHYVPTMIRKQDCEKTLLSAFGSLYQYHIAFDIPKLFPSGAILTDLPRYPWDHNTAYWYESRAAQAWRFRKHGHHHLLGLRVTETTDIDPCWRNVFNLEDEPWLRDHRIRSEVVFPFACYCAIAGEAFRQISGVESGYQLNDVRVSSVLILDDKEPTEIVTALHSCQKADPATTEMYAFTVSSWTRSSWKLHCEGFVSKCVESEQQVQIERTLLREVQPTKWWETFADLGFFAGPAFRRLASITCSTTANFAKAKILNPKSEQEHAFAIHPTAIDACLQLLLTTAARGLCRNFQNLVMPILIEELQVLRTTSDMEATAWSPDDNGSIGLQCVDDTGKVALRLSNLQVSAIDEEDAEEASYMAAQLEWRPDFDFVEDQRLLEPPGLNREKVHLQEEMTALCIIDSALRLENLTTEQSHFSKYFQWLSKQSRHISSDQRLVFDSCKDASLQSHTARATVIKDKFGQILSLSPDDPMAKCTIKIWRHIEDVFIGREQALDILMQDSLLTKLYNVYSFDHSKFMQLLTHKRPNIKILEVGAGTGGTTQTFLKDLVDEDGVPMYSLYTFSDVSAGFFPTAKERFAFAPHMDFQTLDISQNPVGQGFQPETYDLILAANVVHATPVLRDTLRNLKSLLKPEGSLVLTELAGSLRATSYIFGSLSGWWLGEADGRTDSPYVDTERWDRELRSVGLGGVESVVYDAPESYRSCAVMVTKPKTVVENGTRSGSLAILCEESDSVIVRDLTEALREIFPRILTFGLGESVPPQSMILSTLELEGEGLHDMDPCRFSTYQDFIRNHLTQDVLWLVSPSQISCNDPRTAYSIGLNRALRCELAVPYSTLEIEPSEPNFTKFVAQLLQKILAEHDTEIGPDREYAVYKGELHIGRYRPLSLEQAVHAAKDVDSAEKPSQDKLDQSPGCLQNTFETIPDGQMEIQIVAAQPFDISGGIKTLDSHKPSCPFLIAGRMGKVGGLVDLVAPEQRVMAIIPEPHAADHEVCAASSVVAIPDSLESEDAVTMCTSYGVALHSLFNIGRVDQGQQVLVTGASIAAITAAVHVCQNVGVVPFVAVKTEKDLTHFVDHLRLPRNNVFVSSVNRLALEVRHRTNGLGIDIILDLLPSEQPLSLWDCLGEGGSMIQIGGQGAATESRGHKPQVSASNVSVTRIDLARLVKKRPDKARR